MERKEYFNLAILIVLYGCEVKKSRTIETLSKFCLRLSDVKIVVWNNGPSYITTESDYFYENLELVQTLNNISLAKIYNSFVSNVKADKYVFFDHDSDINEDYFNSIKSFSGLIGVPQVYSRGNLHSPRYQKRLLSSKPLVTAIGSGVILSHKVCQELLKKFGSVFDERFVLYGVDTTLFYRLDKVFHVNRELMVLPEINHSLSSNEQEEKIVSSFRIKEKSYDVGLRLRFYPTLEQVVLFFVLLFKSIIRKSPLRFRYIFISLLKGKHYRL